MVDKLGDRDVAREFSRLLLDGELSESTLEYLIKHQQDLKDGLEEIRTKLDSLPRRLDFIRLIDRFDKMPDADLQKLEQQLKDRKIRTDGENIQLTAITQVRHRTPSSWRSNPPITAR